MSGVYKSSMEEYEYDMELMGFIICWRFIQLVFARFGEIMGLGGQFMAWR